MKFRVFISSVQSEFAEERIRLVEYIRKDALLGLFFEPFIFEEVHACNSAPQALNWAGYVEKSGNGTEAIVRRCVQSGLKTPEYHPDNTDFKVIIWRRAQSGHSQGTVRAQSGHSQGKPMSPQKRCLELLVGRELRRKEIAAALGFPNQSGYLNRLLRPGQTQ